MQAEQNYLCVTNVFRSLNSADASRYFQFDFSCVMGTGEESNSPLSAFQPRVRAPNSDYGVLRASTPSLTHFPSCLSSL